MITFKDIEDANKEIQTMGIRSKNGTKQYAEVSERIKAFRKLFPMGRIITEILSWEDGIILMKASVYDDSGECLGTGHAYESESSGIFNKTSIVEVCETSAVGRAIAMLSLGDTSVCSYDEVVAKQKQQEAGNDPVIDDLKKKIIKDKCTKLGWKETTLFKWLSSYGIKGWDEIRTSKFAEIVRCLDDQISKKAEK